MHAVIYCRVSTKEQTKNLSLEIQEKACRDYCERYGLEVDRLFVEEGESAKTAHRPEFQKLVAYCRQNRKQIRYVVVYAISRFSRDKYDHYAVRGVLAGLGVTLRSATEPIDDSSTGKFMEGILAAAAQFDNDVRAERTVAGMKTALGKGRWTFQAPLGYLRGSACGSSLCLVPDPKRGDLIKKTFELYATGGFSKQKVLGIVTRLGLRTRRGKPLSAQTLHNILRNPVYVAQMRVESWKATYQGDFEPLVTEEAFNRVQTLLSRKRSPVATYTRNHPDFPLRRFVRCRQCERPLTGSWSKGRTARYAYYRCPNQHCKSINVRKDVLERDFLQMLEALLPNAEYVELFIAIVLDLWKEKQSEATNIRLGLRKRIEKLQDRKSRLDEAFIYQQAIDRATYQDHVDRLNQEISVTELQLQQDSVNRLDVDAVLAFARDTLSNAADRWTEYTLEQKQRFQTALFPAGLHFDGEKFGTPEMSLMFTCIQGDPDQKTKMASPRGFEPLLQP